MLKRWHNLTWKSRQRLKALMGACLLTPMVTLIQLPRFEAGFFDFWTRAIPRMRPAPEIVLVALDDASATPDEPLPLPMARHAELLSRLVDAAPARIGMLVDFRAVEQVDPDDFEAASRQWLETTKKGQARGVSVLLGTSFDATGEVMPPRALVAAPRAVGVLHRDGNVFAKDDVVRRALLTLYGKPTFHARMAGRSSMSAEFRVPELDARFAFTSYASDPTANPYRVISAKTVLSGLASQDLVGKTVLVGSMSHHQPGDYVRTPYSRGVESSPKLVVHAEVIDAIAHDKAVMVADEAIQAALLFLALFAALGFVLVRSPLTSAGLVLGIAGAAVAIAAVAFWAGVWVLVGQTLVGVAVGYYVTVPVRLLTEYRTRFEFQRKHEILKQVEELKSNFLSLVTHDLKTPVARIQGLAETLVSRLAGSLSAADLEALKRITVATDDLNKFISGILELARVESNQVQLAPESKDINKLVEQAVLDYKELARAKGQIIHTKLDPLFPVRVDPGLLTRVFRNLVDNAVKYSPSDTEITVESQEVGPWIEVRVRDQGQSLTDDERRSLFTKFHRIKREGEVSQGTGLGLYLSRYFVEAHRGQMEVEPRAGAGNSFLVRIPVEGLRR